MNSNFLIFSVLLIGSLFGLDSAFGQTPELSLWAKTLQNSDTITVGGQTNEPETDITFRVLSPSGNNSVAIDQVSPDDNGYFETEFKISSIWRENGFYTITAKQSNQQNFLHSLKVFVEVTNGLTEKTLTTESNWTSDNFAVSGAKNEGLKIYADAVIGSTTIEITGLTNRTDQDITLTVTAPNGNVVSIDRFVPMLNGEFTSVITTGGPLWKQDGFYTVTAQQFDSPEYTDSVEIKLIDGIYILKESTRFQTEEHDNSFSNESNDDKNTKIKELLIENRSLKSKVSSLDNQLITLQIDNRNQSNEIDRLKTLLLDLNHKLQGLNDIVTEQIKVIYEFVVEKK